jgi:hypothetical protein
LGDQRHRRIIAPLSCSLFPSVRRSKQKRKKKKTTEIRGEVENIFITWDGPHLRLAAATRTNNPFEVCASLEKVSLSHWETKPKPEEGEE